METQTPEQYPVKTKKRGAWVVIVIIFAIIVAGATYMMMRDNNDSDEAASIGGTVQITNTALEPQTVIIKKGETVTWTNVDENAEVAHQLMSSVDTDEHSIDSHGPLAPGDTYTAVFEEAGTYKYHDATDPVGMTGVVIVEE